MGLFESIRSFVKGSGSGNQGGSPAKGPSVKSQAASSDRSTFKGRPAPIRQEVEEDDDDLDSVIGEQSEMDPMKESLLSRYKIQSKLSNDDWDGIADRIVIIHENMSLSDAIHELTLWIRDEELPTAPSRDTLDGFAKANAAMKPEHRFKKVGSLADPVRADVYLTP